MSSLNNITKPESWDEFICLNEKKFDNEHEINFVKNILSKIEDINPSSLKLQFPFKDSQGKRRRIDFLIANEDTGQHLAIELDGAHKHISTATASEKQAAWQDHLSRQNDLIPKYPLLLRYSNLYMYQNPEIIIKEVKNRLLVQRKNYVKDVNDKHKILQESLDRERYIASENDKINKLSVEISEVKSLLNLISKNENTNDKVKKNDVKIIIKVTKSVREFTPNHVASKSSITLPINIYYLLVDISKETRLSKGTIINAIISDFIKNNNKEFYVERLLNISPDVSKTKSFTVDFDSSNLSIIDSFKSISKPLNRSNVAGRIVHDFLSCKGDIKKEAKKAKSYIL